MKLLLASLLLACGGAHAVSSIQTNQDDGITIAVTGSANTLCGNTVTGTTYSRGVIPVSDPLYDYKLMALLLMKADPGLSVEMRFRLPNPPLPTTFFGGQSGEKCLIETMSIRLLRQPN